MINELIAKNMSAEADAVKEYLELLNSLPEDSKHREQIKEIIADELQHGLILTAMLVQLENQSIASDGTQQAIDILRKAIK